MPATIIGDVPAEIIPGQGSTYDLPSGASWYVSNRAGVIAGDGKTRLRPLPSIADALAAASAYDTIYVLGGHTENVTASNTFSGSAVNTGAMTIPVGVRIIGEGQLSRRPTLTFTAVASTIALASAGSSIENIMLFCPQTGSTTTTALVTISASSCSVRSSFFFMASSATALSATGVSLGASATYAQITDCVGFTVTGTPTSWISTSATTAPGRVHIRRNIMRMLLSSATGGVIDFSSASGIAPAEWVISDNMLSNLTAASTVVIKGVASAAGHIVNNYLETVGGTAAATAITTPGNMVMFGNQVAQAGKTSIATTTGGAST